MQAVPQAGSLAQMQNAKVCWGLADLPQSAASGVYIKVSSCPGMRAQAKKPQYGATLRRGLR